MTATEPWEHNKHKQKAHAVAIRIGAIKIHSNAMQKQGAFHICTGAILVSGVRCAEVEYTVNAFPKHARRQKQENECGRPILTKSNIEAGVADRTMMLTKIHPHTASMKEQQYQMESARETMLNDNCRSDAEVKR